MIRGLRVSPGPCPVCDAPHTTCTPPGYRPSLQVVQLPSRARVAHVAAVAAAEGTSTTAPPLLPDLPPPASAPVVDDSPRARRQRRALQRRNV